MKSEEQHDLIRQLAEHLLQSGVHGMPREWFVTARAGGDAAPVASASAADRTPERPANPSSAPSLPHAAAPASAPSSIPASGPSPAPSQNFADPMMTPSAPPLSAEAAESELRALRLQAEGCTRCRLCEGRNKVVFGVGNTRHPLIAFVGEGPGADEDRIGEPFVGKAGQLLTAAITKGLGLQREQVYICNVVKCRPPENRAPLPDETAACTPYLYRQLELIAPSVIITLGQPAQRALSGVDMGITKLRGKWQQWRGIPLMPTFHPAYILRNPPAKKEFWEDLQEVMKRLGLPPAC